MSIWRSFLNRFQLSREPIQEPPQVSQIVPDVGPALKLGNRPQILDDASQPSPRQSVEFRDDGGHHTQADLASQKAPISPRNRDLNTCALRFVAELVKISENSERADLSLPTRAVLEFAKTAGLSQDDWMLALALQCTAVSVALDLKKTPEILQSVEQFLTDPIDAELQIVITKLRSGIFEYRKEIENTMMAGNIDSALDRSHALVVALLEAAKENDSLRNELFTACSYVENLANKSYEKYFNLHKASSSRVQRGQAVEEMDKAVRYLADAVRIARRQSNLDYDLTYMADTVRNLRAARR